MYKETITCENFNGVEVTVDAYFNITEAEIMQMELSPDGSYAERLQKLINTKDVKELIRLFTGLIDLSYGEKSEDGMRFVKSNEILQNFKSTAAYSALYMKFVSDADAASKFVNGVFPKHLIQKAKQTPEYQQKLQAINS